MKKLGIVITDGFGFRNFIMSDFISGSTQQFGAITIYSGLPISSYAAIPQSKLSIKELEVYVEGKVTWFFRKWKEVTHLQKTQVFLWKERQSK